MTALSILIWGSLCILHRRGNLPVGGFHPNSWGLHVPVARTTLLPVESEEVGKWAINSVPSPRGRCDRISTRLPLDPQ